MTILFFLAVAFVSWDLTWLSGMAEWGEPERAAFFLMALATLISDVMVIKYFKGKDNE